MINYVEGNILKADADALVNTVNCIGVMGKGIALQYKKAFPENFKAYEKACRLKEVQPGRMFIFETGLLTHPKFIINFPTKRDWKNKSRYEDILSGIKSLVDEIRRLQIKSIAIPPLGCGLGGLDWHKVKPMIEDAFKELSELDVHIYEPKGAPKASEMPIKTKKPQLTPARALFIELMQIYKRLDYRLTLLEIQKLAYFLQEAGLNLKLNYKKHIYGPYAHNLNKVLELLEGHYIQGYGDTQKPDVEITILDGAVNEADLYLSNHQEEKGYLNKVTNLVEGFETPYGLELLSSIHWLIKHDQVQPEVELVTRALQNWNPRKKEIFKEKHIQVALNRLRDQQWVC